MNHQVRESGSMGWAPFRFSKLIAERYLWSRRSEAFITIITVIAVLGVAIGVAVLNIAMSIMTGFESELRQKIVGSTHVLVYRIGGTVSDYEEIGRVLRTVEGVSTVSPFVEQQVMVTSQGKSRGILIRGIAPDSRSGDELAGYIEQPQGVRLLSEPPAAIDGAKEGAPVHLPGLVIGRGLADLMGFFVRQPVSLLLPSVGSTPFGLVPRYKRFVIAGTYKSGLSGYEERLAYMHLPDAQKFFRMKGQVSGFEVMVGSVEESPMVAAAIKEALAASGYRGFVAQDWTQSNKELWEALKMEKQVYFLVLLLLIVMASFSIITTLVMIVLEKRKDIAILMTLGATSRSVARIFRWQGAVIGGLGVFGGTVLGLLGCFALEQYGFPLPEKVFPTATVPVQLNGMNVMIVAVSAFLICLLSTWYPSWRASKVDPSEALRYE